MPLTERTIRRLHAQTASDKLKRMRTEKATPDELAEAAESKRQRELDQRIERLRLEAAAGKAEIDKAYEP